MSHFGCSRSALRLRRRCDYVKNFPSYIIFWTTRFEELKRELERNAYTLS